MKKRRTTNENEKGDLHPSQSLHHRKPLLWVLGHHLRLSGKIFLCGASPSSWHAVFDVLDGKVARLSGATSKFGVQYDSLADLVSFGIAPALLAFSWALRPYGQFGWLAAFLFVVCGALRLAGSMSWPLPERQNISRAFPSLRQLR